ncbi:RER1 protein [Phytophthora cinnamomi]|uniref:RER1 protein n=1 Tax=Phytophthora cinnamomi TaxID=4785 RepID=UPI0035596586|nr:RER1 protein [Phytophthora cinnamomi]
MQANAQYALHDSESAPPAWAARVRLTPELLDKLRQSPEQVLLKLNVAAGDGAPTARSGSKKTSLMTVAMADGETEEQYELLSFPEDPGINHVCTFRHERDDDSAAGYHVYKTGAIHQKLLVQRLLDATEKDRIKDKHAKSVLASKSRSSKLIDSELEKPTKRQRLVTRLSSVPSTRTTAGGSAWSLAAGRKRTRKLVLPSALTKEEANEAKERIEKGFEVEVEEPPLVQTEKEVSSDTEEKQAKEPPTVVAGEATAAAAREAEFNALFSSDSDDEDTGASRPRVLRKSKKKPAKEVMRDSTITAVGTNSGSGQSTDAADAGGKATDTEVDSLAQPKTAAVQSSTSNEGLHDATRAHSKPSGDGVDIYALKPIKPSSSGIEVKRARVRSALVSDRVKQSRLPDLSFFPSAVVQICQRLASYRGRSVILDESDYDSFVETHEQFRQDWEILDKAYSIEMIKVEGLHLQLEVDAADADRKQLEERIKASSSKKEGLLFVRDAMVSIQKILHSLQASVDRFDLKPHTSQHTTRTQ